MNPTWEDVYGSVQEAPGEPSILVFKVGLTVGSRVLRAQMAVSKIQAQEYAVYAFTLNHLVAQIDLALSEGSTADG